MRPGRRKRAGSVWKARSTSCRTATYCTSGLGRDLSRVNLATCGIGGLRVAVRDVFECLAARMSINDILSDFPDPMPKKLGCASRSRPIRENHCGSMARSGSFLDNAR
ncbi:DUF433 domain-containing protein [Gemmata algarum]|uniref:DUF433 domain-containing protein n=1 Tax=Gemmata algarum TaxID=2975278 RepID=UPI0038B36C29